jgi:hypothetical protein
MTEEEKMEYAAHMRLDWAHNGAKHKGIEHRCKVVNPTFQHLSFDISTTHNTLGEISFESLNHSVQQI